VGGDHTRGPPGPPGGPGPRGRRGAPRNNATVRFPRAFRSGGRGTPGGRPPARPTRRPQTASRRAPQAGIARVSIGDGAVALCRARAHPGVGAVVFGVALPAGDPAGAGRAADLLGQAEGALSGACAPEDVERALRSGSALPDAEGLARALGALLAASPLSAPGGAASRVRGVQGEVEATKRVMAANVESVLNRGERIEAVEGRAQEMARAADEFRRTARRARRTLACQSLRTKLAVAAVVAALVFAVTLPVWVTRL